MFVLFRVLLSHWLMQIAVRVMPSEWRSDYEKALACVPGPLMG